MEARTLPNRAAFLAWALAILGAAVLSLVPLSLLDLRLIDAPSLGGGPATNNGPRIAYFEFASTADTLWLADPSDPSRRQKLLVAPHAVDFGVVPSLAPDGRRFVYTALPPATKAPSADTPAGIWMFAPGEKSPRLLDDDADLLVRPVWSSDGGSIVFRRSRAPTQGAPGDYRLVHLDLATGEKRLLVSDAGAALFPVAFSPDGARFYYIRLQPDGSHLFALDLADGVTADVASLAPGLTRDWALSPDGSRIAYLVMGFGGARIVSRAAVLDLASGAIASPGQPGDDAFSPVWSAAGELVFGRTADGGATAGLLHAASDDVPVLPAPRRGFDVPLSFSPAADRLVVRSFDGASAMAPGRSQLTLVGTDGARRTIVAGEVTFLGWLVR